MSNLLITTTPILSNIEIKKYLGPLTANLVLGVNFFSDFAASITDVFGGNSTTYESKLDYLTQEVNKLIKSKAVIIGANAIIDYKLQFNEISGKGKQMFMVTATGTACIIELPPQQEIKDTTRVSFEQIRYQYYLNLYAYKLSEKHLISDKDWDKILSLNISELITPLLTEYIRLCYEKSENYAETEYKEKYSKHIYEYISRIPINILKDNLYINLEVAPDVIIPLIEKSNLFDPSEVLKLLKEGNVAIAISLLSSHKLYYTKDDLNQMMQIITVLDSLPNKGTIENVKGGIFSKKEEEMYICPNGHKNSKDKHFCDNSECGLNIQGLTKQQVAQINQFKKITQYLKEFFK